MFGRSESGDWRFKFSAIQRWGEARKRDLFVDVNFIVGEGKSARWFSAHKNVLAFCSPVFEAMFYGAMAEKKNIIAIVDIDPGVFNVLLRFAYGETIYFPSVSFAGKTHLAADKYLIPDLQEMADEHISKATMDESQFWEVFQQDIFFLVPVVKKKCLGYISQSATHLFKSYLFTRIPYDVLLEILQMDKIHITEFELLSAVVRWGIGNIQSGKNLKSTIGSLLEYIRFTNLTVEGFCKFSDSHPDLLDAGDALAIRKHLRNRLKYKLPEWCSKSSIKRHQEVQTFHNFYCRCSKCM